MKDSVSTHRTGFPDRLLRYFESRPPLPYLPPIEKEHPTMPYTGIAEFVNKFAEPGDPEYKPAPPEDAPQEPRFFCNPELAQQTRTYVPTRLER